MTLDRAIAAAMRGLRRALPRALACATLCASVLGASALGGTAAAEEIAPQPALELASEAAPRLTLQAPLDKAVSLTADGPVGKVVVSQPETLQVAQAPDGLYVIGSQLGPANILVYDDQGRLSQTVDVNVGYDAQALREQLADALPGEPIVVKALSSSLLLEGEVSRPSVIRIAERLAERVAPDAVVSRLHAQSNQVLLDVRILEVSSRALKDISTAMSIDNGSGATVTTGGVAIGADAAFGVASAKTRAGAWRLAAALRALESRGELRVMAEPSLIVLSGETATFRAGGEFPVPVPADVGQLTIQFRPYGTSMTFKPVVQENGTIRVALEAELSDIDPAVSLNVGGYTVPGLKVRRAATVADLRDGEAFLIAGLFAQTEERQARGLPFLDRIPLLGPVLTRAVDATRRNDTRQELAILVTPHLNAQVASPLAETKVADARQPAPPEAPTAPKATKGLRGPPIRLMVAELKQALRPPVQWLGRTARQFAALLRERA